MSKIITIFLFCLTLAACSPFVPEPRDYGAALTPRYFSLYNDDESYLPGEWWCEFNDAELNALVALALRENLDVMQAWARLDQLRARYAQAFSGFLPTIELDGGYSAERRQTDVRAGSSITSLGNTENYSLGLFASYEVDLWGRVYATTQSQQLNMQAGQNNLEAMAESIAATVASYWVQIIAARQEIAILRRQLVTNEKYLELVELRYASGMVIALDVLQQRQTVARTKTQLPLAIRNEQLLVNDLKLLLGQTRDYHLGITRDRLPDLIGTPVTGLPAELLQNRPDVHAAGKRLYAAQWGIAQARADRLPAIRLTASGQTGSDDLAYLFSNWVATLATNLVAPLFDGGRRAAEVDYQQALAAENLAAYQKTVLTAVNEVEATLWNESAQREYLTHLTTQREAAQLALDEATFRYINGLESYLPVLTQLDTVQTLEITAVQQQAQLLLNRVTLYRALGGGIFTEILLTE